MVNYLFWLSQPGTRWVLVTFFVSLRPLYFVVFLLLIQGYLDIFHRTWAPHFRDAWNLSQIYFTNKLLLSCCSFSVTWNCHEVWNSLQILRSTPVWHRCKVNIAVENAVCLYLNVCAVSSWVCRKNHCDLQPWAQAVRTFPGVPRST